MTDAPAPRSSSGSASALADRLETECNVRDNHPDDYCPDLTKMFRECVAALRSGGVAQCAQDQCEVRTPAIVQRIKEACAQVADRAALRCVREQIPGDATATFIAKAIRALIPPATSPPAALPAGAWQPIETAPESIQKFAKDCVNHDDRGGYIEFGGTTTGGLPFVLCRNNDGWQRFDRYLILPSVDTTSVSSTTLGRAAK